MKPLLALAATLALTAASALSQSLDTLRQSFLAFLRGHAIVTAMNEHPQISADPNVMTGMPCIKGTRVTVANVVRQIAAGRTPDQIVADYPYLTIDSIRAALSFAADLAAAETHEMMAS